jgi:DNA mismatch endonuclease (patch repair protein)
MDRSENMRAIHSKGMSPELAVRRLVHQSGYRYRLHRGDLPGRPDLVFGPRHKVIFVHGCFWHAHGCNIAHIPKSNTNYWLPKLRRNRARDLKNLKNLTVKGWRTLVLWECETRDEVGLKGRLRKFLGRRPVRG